MVIVLMVNVFAMQDITAMNVRVNILLAQKIVVVEELVII